MERYALPASAEYPAPVAELIDVEDDAPPIAERYTAEFVATLVAVPPELVETIDLGWIWDGTTFSPPLPPEVSPPQPPQSVRAWAAKAVLAQHELFDQAKAAADAAGGAWPFRFDLAPDWSRADCLQLGIGGMGLAEAQVDAMLFEAAALGA